MIIVHTYTLYILYIINHSEPGLLQKEVLTNLCMFFVSRCKRYKDFSGHIAQKETTGEKGPVHKAMGDEGFVTGTNS